MMNAFAMGMWMGFLVAAPIGPVGIVVLRRTLAMGWRAGVASGAGVALADLCLAMAAAEGVRVTAGYSRVIGVVGGLVLLWMAWGSWHRGEQKPVPERGSGDALRNGATIFVLAIMNPMAILTFATLMTSVHCLRPELFAAGMAAGSLLWWLILSAGAQMLTKVLAERSVMINRVSGVVLAGFGVWAIVSVMR